MSVPIEAVRRVDRNVPDPLAHRISPIRKAYVHGPATKPPVRAFWITTEHGPPSPRLMLIDKVAIAPAVVIVPSRPRPVADTERARSESSREGRVRLYADRPSLGAHVVCHGAVFEAGVHRAGTYPCAADVRKSCGSGRTRRAVAATGKRNREQHPEQRSHRPGADGSTRISRPAQFVECPTRSVTLEAK